MLSNPQKSLLKRAQREAGISDADYRDALSGITGQADCRSSTDPRLTDDHLDRLIKLFEWHCWVGRREGKLPAPGPKAVFSKPDFWKERNPRNAPSSRDRYTSRRQGRTESQLETELQRLGKGGAYLAQIRSKTGGGWPYRAALERTLRSLSKGRETRGEGIAKTTTPQAPSP